VTDGNVKRLKGGPRFGRAVEPGRAAFPAVGKYDGVNGDPARAELRERRAASELQIVGMGAQCQYGFNHIHNGQLGRAPLTPRFESIRFGANCIKLLCCISGLTCALATQTVEATRGRQGPG
jgi:hypothetical protein